MLGALLLWGPALAHAEPPPIERARAAAQELATDVTDPVARRASAEAWAALDEGEVVVTALRRWRAEAPDDPQRTLALAAALAGARTLGWCAEVSALLEADASSNPTAAALRAEAVACGPAPAPVDPIDALVQRVQRAPPAGALALLDELQLESPQLTAARARALWSLGRDRDALAVARTAWLAARDDIELAEAWALPASSRTPADPLVLDALRAALASPPAPTDALERRRRAGLYLAIARVLLDDPTEPHLADARSALLRAHALRPGDPTAALRAGLLLANAEPDRALDLLLDGLAAHFSRPARAELVDAAWARAADLLAAAPQRWHPAGVEGLVAARAGIVPATDAPLSDAAHPLSGAALPPLSYRAESGAERQVARRGPVVIEVWASWCVDALTALEAVVAAGGLPSGAEVYALSVDAEPAAAFAFAEARWGAEPPFTVGWGGPPLADRLHASAIPLTVLARDGTARAVLVGHSGAVDDLARLINQELSDSADADKP